MKKFLFLLAVLLFTMGMVGAAWAEKPDIHGDVEHLKRIRLLSVDFEEKFTKYSDIQAIVDARILETENMVSGFGIKDFILEAVTYQTSMIQNGTECKGSGNMPCYQLNGYVTLMLIPDDREKSLLEYLVTKGYTTKSEPYYFGECSS